MPESAKILIIDDDEDYRASTRALLEAEGHMVTEADSGQVGLSAAREHLPDLIIVDIMMENISTGYSIVQTLKFSREYRDLAQIPILMISSVEEDPETMFGWIGDTKWITPDAYLTKPIDIPTFVERVRELLSKKNDQ